jgi:hypothetical protein
MSGYARDEVVGRGLIPADRPFLQKPFTGAELVDVVGRELDRAAAPWWAGNYMIIFRLGGVLLPPR